MIWKEFMHIREDKFSIRLMIVEIIAQLLIMGYALTTEVKNTPIGIYDQSNTPSSRSLVASIRANNLFRYKGDYDNYDNLIDAIKESKLSLALIIPSDFQKQIYSKKGCNLQLLVDGQDANSANVSSGYINAVVNRWKTDFIYSQYKRNGTSPESIVPFAVRMTVLYNPLLKSTWYMVPALVVLLVTMVTSLLSGLSIVKEREAGTLEQLLVTPISTLHILAGKTIPYFILGFIELCIFLLFAQLWFRIPFRGNYFTVALFGFIYMLSSIGIGILTSTLARTPQQVLLLIWFTLLFFMLLSGFFIPIENMPTWVQHVTVINPVRWFMLAVREIFLKGSTLAELWYEAVVMFITGVIVFGFSILFFHRRVQ
jgi:ABC-2 type transport system permease protein